MWPSQLKNSVGYDKLLFLVPFVNNTDVMQRQRHACLTGSLCLAPDYLCEC